MTRIMHHELLHALRAEGLKVVVVRLDGRKWPDNTSAGAFNPRGIMNHHTAMNSRRIRAATQVALLWRGRTGLPGPLAHIGLGRRGTVYLVGWNNANHAGEGDGKVLRAITYERDLPEPLNNDIDGNPYFWGIEVMNDGVGEHYPAEQIEALVKCNAAIIRATNAAGGNWTEKSSLHHKEWTNRKIDMSYTHALRPMIHACLAKKPGQWRINSKAKPVAVPVKPERRTTKAKKEELSHLRRLIRNTKHPLRLANLKRIRAIWRRMR